ncbi:MAG: rhodanese-like domain-containing protein [Chloroflexi bacterium]|nr:rhodanese-like domain-containing protein [Chloroflexota bacterium]
MHAPWWWPFGRVDEIEPRELQLKIGAGADLQLLDVREHFEHEAGHIAGARNVPIHDLPRRLDALRLDPRRPVVAICLSGHRSIPAYRLLKRKGFREVRSLAGGMMAWRRAKLPTTRDRTA